ncbi:hypothetical protein SESBI_42720 [Sesbania bispinosa]|nr:hypothetical protein SESBI_42720 [Sesbania bispinosa]
MVERTTTEHDRGTCKGTPTLKPVLYSDIEFRLAFIPLSDSYTRTCPSPNNPGKHCPLRVPMSNCTNFLLRILATCRPSRGPEHGALDIGNPERHLHHHNSVFRRSDHGLQQPESCLPPLPVPAVSSMPLHPCRTRNCDLSHCILLHHVSPRVFANSIVHHSRSHHKRRRRHRDLLFASPSQGARTQHYWGWWRLVGGGSAEEQRDLEWERLVEGAIDDVGSDSMGANRAVGVKPLPRLILL